METQTLASAVADLRATAGVVVLGMGRSGTSVVTQCLVKAGFYAGAPTELMAPTQANPAGYYENLSVFRLNEEILHRLGATWFMPPTSEAQSGAASWAVPALKGVVERLIDEARGAPVVVKDPRIGVLLGLWGPVIADALHPVLVVRNPVEIAQSLATRDGTPLAFGLASWELHTAGVLEFLGGRDVTIVPYSRLISSPSAAADLVTAVGAALPSESGADLDPGAATAAIDPALYRERADPADTADCLTARQAKLWQFLESLAPGSQILDVPAEVSRASRTAELAVRRELDRVRTQHDLANLRARVAEYESALADAESALAEAERSAVDERERARAAEHWLEELEASASWRLTAPLRTILRGLRRAAASR